MIAGEQARYRVQSSAPHQVVSWAVGGGAVSHAPDPAHPDDLLLIADQPGDLTIIARVREGLTERRATKSVTAVPEVTPPAPPFTLRLFLHGWGLVVVAVLIIGFAGALDALGNFTSSDFIALAVPLAALLGVIAVARGASEPSGRPGHGTGHGAGAGHGTGSGTASSEHGSGPSGTAQLSGPAPLPLRRTSLRPHDNQRHHLAHTFVSERSNLVIVCTYPRKMGGKCTQS